MIPSYEDYVPQYEISSRPSPEEEARIKRVNRMNAMKSKRLIQYLKEVDQKYPDILARIIKSEWLSGIHLDEFDQIRFWDWSLMLPYTGCSLTGGKDDYVLTKRGCFTITSHDLTKAVMIAMIVNKIIYELAD